MTEAINMWPSTQIIEEGDATDLRISLDADVLVVIQQEARDRRIPVETLIANLVRFAAMKSEHNETIHSAIAPIGLV